MSEYCCRGECCGPGSWCCQHAGPHNHGDAVLEVTCGLALEAHYADNKWQTFHHAPSVAAVVLDAVPDGMAKINGEWVQIKPAEPQRLTGHGLKVGDLEPFKTMLVELLALHEPSDEEAEFWFDQAGHREQFPECKTEDQCEGHTVTIQVCRECGHEHDDGYPVFRAWPCPTRKLVEAFRG